MASSPVVSVRMPEPLVEQLRRIAAERRTSVGLIIKGALVAFLKRQEGE